MTIKLGKLTFKSQELVTTAWSMATILVSNVPFLASIAAEARPRIQEFAPIDLTNLAWAFSTLEVANAPLLKAIAEAVIPKIAEFGN